MTTQTKLLVLGVASLLLCYACGGGGGSDGALSTAGGPGSGSGGSGAGGGGPSEGCIFYVEALSTVPA